MQQFLSYFAFAAILDTHHYVCAFVPGHVCMRARSGGIFVLSST